MADHLSYLEMIAYLGGAADSVADRRDLSDLIRRVDVQVDIAEMVEAGAGQA